MDRHKLGIIVPYRRRVEQIDYFVRYMTNYLKDKNIRYEIIVIDQDDAKQFNRGILLNIGYIYAKKSKCDYIVFHDVDMIPIDVDYSYSDIPLHLATDFLTEHNEKKREIFEEYFGGVTLFPISVFEKINGYSNKYWGWGFEDTDLLFRCKVNGISLDKLKLKNFGKKGKSLKFNGIDAYVEFDNVIDLDKDATFFVNFFPERIPFDHTKSSDEFTVFSIPGWDFAICYNSFSRYNFCAFDTVHKAYFINSEIKPKYKTTICVILDRSENLMKMYQDGVFIGQTESFRKLYFYRKEPKAYLGVGKPEREKIPNYFKGTISSFAYFDKILSEKEIVEISNNESYTMRKNFGDYESSGDLKCYFDSNHISKNYELLDLSGNKNDGSIFNCEIVEDDYDEFVEVDIPFRRKSIFKSLPHEENGFTGYGWKDQATRWNQLRFHNEVVLNPDLINEDGISNLEFIEHGKERVNKITHVIVGI